MAALERPLDLSAYVPDEAPDTEAHLNSREKALRDLFVAEYITDYDQVRAAMRCGFQYQFAVEFASKFMQEAYVQQRIKQVTFQDAPSALEEVEYNKKRIKAALMQEAHYRGPGSSHAARVAALANLAKLNGMEPPKKVDQTLTHRGGVMAVPGIAKLDDWEKTASASQDELVKHAGS